MYSFIFICIVTCLVFIFTCFLWCELGHACHLLTLKSAVHLEPSWELVTAAVRRRRRSRRDLFEANKLAPDPVPASTRTSSPYESLGENDDSTKSAIIP